MARWIISFLLFIMLSYAARGQHLSPLDSLYINRQYATLLITSKDEIRKCPTCPLPYFYCGKVYYDQSAIDSALYYFTMAKRYDIFRTYITAWSGIYLARIAHSRGRDPEARDLLLDVLKLGKTNNSIITAARLLDTVSRALAGDTAGYYSLDNLARYEGKNIIYYFDDTAGKAALIAGYIVDHEAAYDSINSFFNAKLPHKAIFYVWFDRDRAYSFLKRPVGFTIPDKCISFVFFGQTVGHELTHTLAYWAWGLLPLTQTKFINEGIAVRFDQQHTDRIQLARLTTKKLDYKSVADIWKGNPTEESFYPIAGAFIDYLFATSTPMELRSIIKNQSYEHASSVYGTARLQKIIEGFDQLVFQ